MVIHDMGYGPRTPTARRGARPAAFSGSPPPPRSGALCGAGGQS